MPIVFKLAHLTRKSFNNDPLIQGILSYFILYSQPKISRGKTWYVLNSIQFGQDNGPSRKLFSQNATELKRRNLICEISPFKERGVYYSITPLGICNFQHQFPFIPRVKILETFATKYTPPYKSNIFGSEKINFKGYVNYLPNNQQNIKDLNAIFWSILQSLNVNENGIIISLPIPSRGNFNLDFSRLDFENEEIKLIEYAGNEFSTNIQLNEFQLYQYLSKLILCMLVYIHAYDEHGWSVLYQEHMKLEGKKPHSTDINPTIFENEIFKQVTFFIHRTVQNLFDGVKKDMNYFSNTLNDIQFEVEIK